MAFVNDVAASAGATYDALIEFLTENVDLVADGQEWVNVWEHANGPRSGIVLRGPGLSGNDQVYVGMALFADPLLDSFWIEAVGMTGIIPGSASYRDHINVTPSHVKMMLDVGTTEYWFVANGRRFMVTAKISTVFETMYAGLFLPYGTPLTYPYPMFIGGSAGQWRSNTGVYSWRDEIANHTHYLWGHSAHQESLGTRPDCTGWFIDPSGQWRRVNATGNQNEVFFGPHVTGNESYMGMQYGEQTWAIQMTDAFGGDRMLIPATLLQYRPGDMTWGVLDGAARCQGVLNAAENTITIDGVSWLVVQNCFRTSFDDYWAMKLE